MDLLLLVGLLFTLIFLGVPVAFSLGISSCALFILNDIPISVAVQRWAASTNLFVLMAIPFFVFSGELMARSGIAARLIQLADSILGRSRGGLAKVNVGASMIFGSVSGSAVASVSAIGGTMMPMMSRKGYGEDYSVAITAAAAILGILIPPSHNMVIYSAASPVSVSVGDLFIAGVVPGVLCALSLIVASHVVAVKRDHPRGQAQPLKVILRGFFVALPGICTGLIIVLGIVLGVFTPTESAAVAVVYTMLIGVLIYRTLSLSEIFEAAISSVRTTALVMMIIGCAGMFSWLFALFEGPIQLAAFVLSISSDPSGIILLILLVLLALGAFMDMAPLIIITTPIFLPLAVEAGVDPVQFGVMMMLALGVGLVTPPVGSVLFVGCAVGQARVERVIREILPFYLALVGVLLAVSFLPSLTLWLPGVIR